MAISTALVTQGGLPHTIWGTQRMTVTDVTMDNSYPTGGEVVTAEQLGLNQVITARASIKTPTSSGVNTVAATPVTGQADGSVLLKVFNETPAEVANGGDLTAMVVRVTAMGH